MPAATSMASVSRFSTSITLQKNTVTQIAHKSPVSYLTRRMLSKLPACMYSVHMYLSLPDL